MTTGIPINPNYFTGLKYNSAFYNTSGGLTLAEALTKFLAFPIAQGNETLASVIVADTLTASKNIIMNGATGVSGNYIQFPDGTRQLTAVDPNDYATLNDSNIFLSQLSPNQPNQQTITGNSLSGNTNAPLVIKNVDTNEYIGLYIDPAPTFDATLYSNQTSGGLTLRNVDGNSFTMTPSAPNNTALFSNPISCGTNTLTAGQITGSQLTLTSGANTSVLTTSATGLNIADPIVSTGSITGSQLTIANVNGVDTSVLTSTSTGLNVADPIVSTSSITGTQLTLSSGANTSVLTTSATGLNVADPIVATGNVTSTGFVISDGVDDIYSLYSQNNYGFVIANTTLNGLGTLSLSNGGASVSTITCSGANALSFGQSSLTTTGAISGSQLTLTSGTGSTIITTDASGLNIPDDVTAIAQTYNGSLTYGNVLSTQGFVDLAISGNAPTVVSGLTVTVANVTLGGSPSTVRSSSSPTWTSFGLGFYFTPTQNLNAFTVTFNKAYYQGTFSSAQTLNSVCVGTVNNLEVGIKATYSPTSILFTAVATPSPAFPNGVNFYFNFSANIYTT